MVYLKLISMSFQRSIVYRIEYFTSLLNALLYIFIFVSIWKHLIPEKGLSNGITREMMISYAVFSTLIKVTFARSQTFISSKVRTGEIAVDLMKPFSLPLMYLSDLIGKSLFQFFARGIPLFVFSIFVFRIRFFFPGEIWLQFSLVYLLSFVIYFLISLILSSLSFFFVEIFPFWILYFSLVTLLSGAVIPLDFFPDNIKSFILFTPFPYLFYFPTMVLLYSENLILSYFELLLHYFVVILILLVVAILFYRRGVRRLTIVGG